jgi:hypothetical protein
LLTININGPQLKSIELVRLALSEESHEQRLLAIKTVKHDVVASLLSQLFDAQAVEGRKPKIDKNFMQWVAETAGERHEAAFELSQIGKRYEDKNEKKLNVAEQIGKLVWLSIQDNKFEGVQTDNGLLHQVQVQARKFNISGARDKDTVRKIWNTYRGIVHLGMAIDYCDESPDQNLNILYIAERYRRDLSQNCPKGTSEPYVDPNEQISFLYISRLWGPRFGDRGLPFYVD